MFFFGEVVLRFEDWMPSEKCNTNQFKIGWPRSLAPLPPWGLNWRKKSSSSSLSLLPVAVTRAPSHLHPSSCPSSHPIGYRCEWVRMCNTRLCLCFDFLWHTGHSNLGSTPHSKRLCRFRLCGRAYELPHRSQVKAPPVTTGCWWCGWCSWCGSTVIASTDEAAAAPNWCCWWVWYMAAARANAFVAAGVFVVLWWIDWEEWCVGIGTDATLLASPGKWPVTLLLDCWLAR